jgi:uncharacterized membrane protein YhaH (DUF805 family)
VKAEVIDEKREEAMDWYVAILKQFTVFAGRTSRREYWKFVLVNIIIGVVLAIVSNIIRDPGVIQTLFLLANVVFGLAVAIRRLHDADLSGWWALIGLIPILGAVALVILLILPGRPTENRYGPVPTPAAAQGNEKTGP